MPVAFRCGLAVPLWAVAFCAVAFSAPRTVMPLLMTLLALGVVASMMPAVARRFGLSRRGVEVLPAMHNVSRPGGIITAGRRTQTLDAAIDARAVTDDAADLVRMDDDGGWHMARHSPLADGAVPRKNQRLL